MNMPSLVIMGEDDPLTDPAATSAHVDAIADAKELLFYVGEDHAPDTLAPPVSSAHRYTSTRPIGWPTGQPGCRRSRG